MSRDFSGSQRNTIWERYFGDSSSGIDAFGRRVWRNNFECDHVFPYSEGGKTVVNNGIPLHPDSNDEKSDNMSGYVNGLWFEIEGNPYRGILWVEGEEETI